MSDVQYRIDIQWGHKEFTPPVPKMVKSDKRVGGMMLRREWFVDLDPLRIGPFACQADCQDAFFGALAARRHA